MRRYIRRTFIDFPKVFTDIIYIVISYLLTAFIIDKSDYMDTITKNIWILISFTFIFICIMLIMQMYNLTTFVYQDRVLKRIVKSSIISYAFCYYLLACCIQPEKGNKLFSIVFLLIVLLVLPSQCIISHEIKKSKKKRWSSRVLVIGNCENIREYLYFLNKTSFSVNVVGYISTESNGEIPDQTNLGSLSDLDNILVELAVDEVVFATHYSKIKELEEYASMCEERCLVVRIALDFSEMNSEMNYVHSIGMIPMLTFSNSLQNDLGVRLKRFSDVIVSSIGLLLLSIIIGIVSILKIFSSKSSLFTTDPYITKNGRKFKLIAFNVEINNLSSRLLKKIGVLNLPQVINVLKGDMSIVGTQPTNASEIKEFSKHELRRISVKPGMTGLWWLNIQHQKIRKSQISKSDDGYISNWSYVRDGMIFIETIFLIIIGKAKKSKYLNRDNQ